MSYSEIYRSLKRLNRESSDKQYDCKHLFWLLWSYWSIWYTILQAAMYLLVILMRIKILSWASRTWSQVVRGGLSPSDQPRQHLVGSFISLTHALPWFLHLSDYLVSNIICLAETIGFYGTVPVCNIFQRDFMVGSLLTNLYFRLFARVLSPKSWTSFCQSP